MTEDEIVAFTGALPGAAVVTAGEGTGAPEAAWGDSFFFYDPDGMPEARRLPFATVVVKDYEGFDTSSDLNRPGVFRLNVAVGRERFEAELGYAPAEHAGRAAGIDHAVLDEVIPHPVYAAQGWLSIVCPGPRTDEAARALIAHAHRRAADRHRGPERD